MITKLEKMMYKTAEQRVDRGIAWLDMSRNVPNNWRSKINLKELRFADPDRGPLGQLFGDYLTGLKTLGIVGGAAEFGFRTAYNKLGDPAELRKVWETRLRTDKSWIRLGNDLSRIIKGVRYLIYKDKIVNEVKVMYFVAGQAIPFSRSYCSYDSAKRAVRKQTSN